MGSPESKPQNTENKKISPTVSLEIYSEINECFAKTIVTQKFTNSSNTPLELQIYMLKKKSHFFFLQL